MSILRRDTVGLLDKIGVDVTGKENQSCDKIVNALIAQWRKQTKIDMLSRQMVKVSTIEGVLRYQEDDDDTLDDVLSIMVANIREFDNLVNRLADRKIINDKLEIIGKGVDE